MGGRRSTLSRVDNLVAGFMERHGVTLLRLSLAVVFIWFGALKLIGRSPVAQLVAATVYWLPPRIFVPVLGVWEVAIGLGLLFNLALRFTLFLFFLQMAGTFLVLLLRPERAFAGSPFFLTAEGEFVVKNLVLVSAGLVIGGTVRRRRLGRDSKASTPPIATMGRPQGDLHFKFMACAYKLRDALLPRHRRPESWVRAASKREGKPCCGQQEGCSDPKRCCEC